jgi:hypothetical protein
MCELSWYWAATDLWACNLNADPCGSDPLEGECSIDPESLPVFDADDCVYTCTEHSSGHVSCGAYYFYDNYDCRCSDDPPTQPLGACRNYPMFGCIDTTRAICEQSGFDYDGDGTRCEVAVPALGKTGGVILAVLMLLGSGYFVARRLG